MNITQPVIKGLIGVAAIVLLALVVVLLQTPAPAGATVTVYKSPT